MTENKIFCSADEYAWLEEGLRSARRAYEYATTKARPDSAIAASAAKHKARAEMFAIALDKFTIRPGSVRSEGEQIYSAEFVEAFGKIPGSEINPVCIMVDESQMSVQED